MPNRYRDHAVACDRGDTMRLLCRLPFVRLCIAGCIPCAVAAQQIDRNLPATEIYRQVPVQPSVGESQPDLGFLPLHWAQKKAREAAALAVIASRKALKAEAQAQAAAGMARLSVAGYMAATSDLGYHYEGGKLHGQRDEQSYDGFGILSWPNGNYYRGEFRQGRKRGYGVYDGAGGEHYEGRFANGINGYGIYRYSNGDRYAGEVRDGLRNGYGVMRYPSGGRYEGQWRNGEKNGYGVLLDVAGAVENAGVWGVNPP